MKTLVFGLILTWCFQPVFAKEPVTRSFPGGPTHHSGTGTNHVFTIEGGGKGKGGGAGGSGKVGTPGSIENGSESVSGSGSGPAPRMTCTSNCPPGSANIVQIDPKTGKPMAEGHPDAVTITFPPVESKPPAPSKPHGFYPPNSSTTSTVSKPHGFYPPNSSTTDTASKPHGFYPPPASTMASDLAKAKQIRDKKNKQKIEDEKVLQELREERDAAAEKYQKTHMYYSQVYNDLKAYPKGELKKAEAAYLQAKSEWEEINADPKYPVD